MEKEELLLIRRHLIGISKIIDEYLLKNHKFIPKNDKKNDNLENILTNSKNSDINS